jgi:hypothetical protein
MLNVLLAALWIGPAMSGAWYSPERNGEGFTLQVLDNGTAHMIWYTYPPVGAAGQQAWIYAQDGRIEGDRVTFDDAFTTRGPRFGAAYDPAALQMIPWGRIEVRFASCNEAQLSYQGPSQWGSGAWTVTRLTALAELECTGKRRLGANGARTAAGLRSRNGLWYDPAHNGEGWTVEELPDGRAQVYWFTYDANGDQAWMLGVSATSGDRIDVPDLYRATGTRFGAAFDRNQVQLSPWGRLDLRLTGCLSGTLQYTAVAGGFGSGSLAPVRLTQPAGAVCLEGAPAVPAVSTWGQAQPMALANSEAATVVMGNFAYVAGGFGGPDSLQRYDFATNTWVSLAPMPGGRDHPLGVAFGGDLYVTGGNHQPVGSHGSNGWRYVAAQNRWENVAGLPGHSAAGAAVLGGFAYFSDTGGGLVQFDPRTGLTRTIASDNRAPRDHSQMVAFQGELWMLGGRQLLAGTSRAVSIYDPASETWRAGPAMRSLRSGFAAAASPTMLMVAGGEFITSNPVRVIETAEAIAAGQQDWTSLPALPTPVHGMGGAIQGNNFYVFGGSTVAAQAVNTGLVQVLRW